MSDVKIAGTVSELQSQVLRYHERWQKEQELRRQADQDNLQFVNDLQVAEREMEMLRRVIRRQKDAISEHKVAIASLRDTVEYGTHKEEKEAFYGQGYGHGLEDGERRVHGLDPHGPRMAG